jgi:hypothetical protein
MEGAVTFGRGVSLRLSCWIATLLVLGPLITSAVVSEKCRLLVRPLQVCTRVISGRGSTFACWCASQFVCGCCR